MAPFLLNSFLSGIAYLLKTAFAAATPATLTNGQVLDTAAEGMVVGGGTAYDSDANYAVSLSTSGFYNNESASAGSGFGVLGVDWITVPRSAGRVIKGTMKISSIAAGKFSPWIWLTDDATAPPASSRIYQCVFASDLLAFAEWDASDALTVNPTQPSAISANTWYDVAIVLRSAGAYFFTKLGGAWTLIGVAEGNSAATMYLNTTWNAAANAGIGTLGYLAVTETLYPNLVQTVAEDDFNNSTGSNVALTAWTPDKGGVWELGSAWGVGYSNPSVFVSNANDCVEASATLGTNGNYYIAMHHINTGLVDVLVVADVTLFAVTGSGNPGITARSGNVLGELVTSSGGTHYGIRIQEIGVIRGATVGPINVNTTYPNCQLRVVGASVTFIAAGLTVTAILASSLTGTKQGFLSQVIKVSGVDSTTKYDNFKVYPAIAKQVSSTTVAEDDFSDAGNPVMSGKALDKGGAWQLENDVGDADSGTATVNSTTGKATLAANGTGSRYRAQNFTCDSGYADVLVQCDMTFINASGLGNVSLVARAASSFLQDGVFAYPTTGTSQSHGIYERNGGAQSLRGAATFTITPNTEYQVKLRCLGSYVEFSVGRTGAAVGEGGTVVANGAITGLTNTRCGFGLIDKTDTTPSTVDNFKVYPFTELYDYDKVLDAI